jgi:predicted Zn-dependent protease with MMP-like domain
MAEFSDDLQPMLDAADAMLAEGQAEEALIHLEKLSARFPDSPDLELLMGDALFDLGDLEACLECYDRAVELDPDWSDARSARANCLVELGRVQEAKSDVEAAIKQSSSNSQAHHVRGIVLELCGQLRQAEEAYRTAARMDPEVYFEPVRVNRKVFDKAVKEAIKRLPDRFRDRMEGVDIYVKDLPSPEDNPDAPLSPLIMGAFDGYSLTERRESDPWSQFPPRIYLYQRNIERVCATRTELIEEIEVTLMHEVGHFFGLEEDDLDRIDLA